MSRSFKANDKILVHLLDYYNTSDKSEYPIEITQGGMAKQLDLRQNTISYALKGLMEESLVREKLARVKGKKQKLKTYHLTCKGLGTAKTIEKEMEEFPVKIEKGSEEKILKAKEVNDRLNLGMNLLDLISRQKSYNHEIEIKLK